MTKNNNKTGLNGPAKGRAHGTYLIEGERPESLYCLENISKLGLNEEYMGFRKFMNETYSTDPMELLLDTQDNTIIEKKEYGDNFRCTPESVESILFKESRVISAEKQLRGMASRNKVDSAKNYNTKNTTYIAPALEEEIDLDDIIDVEEIDTITESEFEDFLESKVKAYASDVKPTYNAPEKKGLFGRIRDSISGYTSKIGQALTANKPKLKRAALASTSIFMLSSGIECECNKKYVPEPKKDAAIVDASPVRYMEFPAETIDLRERKILPEVEMPVTYNIPMKIIGKVPVNKKKGLTTEQKELLRVFSMEGPAEIMPIHSGMADFNEEMKKKFTPKVKTKVQFNEDAFYTGFENISDQFWDNDYEEWTGDIEIVGPVAPPQMPPPIPMDAMEKKPQMPPPIPMEAKNVRAKHNPVQLFREGPKDHIPSIPKATSLTKQEDVLQKRLKAVRKELKARDYPVKSGLIGTLNRNDY